MNARGRIAAAEVDGDARSERDAQQKLALASDCYAGGRYDISGVLRRLGTWGLRRISQACLGMSACLRMVRECPDCSRLTRYSEVIMPAAAQWTLCGFRVH
jgi:hypothetical protein